MRKVLALLAMIVSIFALAACGDSHGASSNTNPSSLIGEWSQVNPNSGGWMTASISGESIQVNLKGRESSSIYWMGSFDTSRKPLGKFKVVSLGDQDAMKWQITASTDSKKTFTYDNGELSFKFSALGSSTIVHMTQTKSVSTPTRTVTFMKTPAVRSTPKTVAPKVSTLKK